MSRHTLIYFWNTMNVWMRIFWINSWRNCHRRSVDWNRDWWSANAVPSWSISRYKSTAAPWLRLSSTDDLDRPAVRCTRPECCVTVGKSSCRWFPVACRPPPCRRTSCRNGCTRCSGWRRASLLASCGRFDMKRTSKFDQLITEYYESWRVAWSSLACCGEKA